MAGDVKVAVVSADVPSGSGSTTDFTKAGFGTPKACLVIASLDPSDDTAVDSESVVSIGFSDFSSDFCISHQDADASAKVDCDAIKSNTSCYRIMPESPGSNGPDGTASTIADGVRLTNSAAAGSIGFATVIMFGGADLAVSLQSSVINSSQDGTATVAHSGFTDGNDKLIFFIGSDISGEDSASSGINNSFGVCHATGSDSGGWTLVQRCMGWASDHAASVSAASATINTDQVLSMITEAGTQDWSLEVTALSNSGGTWTVTTRDNGAGAGMEVYSLALDLDDRKAKVGSVNAPTTGSTWTPSVSLGFTPQYVGLGTTLLSTENTINSSTLSGALGVSSNTGSGEETCHSWYNEDAVPDTNTNNLFRSRAVDLRNHSTGAVVFDFQHSSFNSGGWTYAINTVLVVTAKWFYWAIEEAAAVTPIGEGSLDAANTNVTGEGTSSSAGEGDLDSAAATLSGEGLAAHLGEGDLAAAAATMAGTGVVDAKFGEGDLAAVAATLAGEGTSQSIGEGVLDSAAAAVAGEGTSASVGEGALDSAAATVAGDGKASYAGIGNLSAAASVVAGEGLSKSVGEGTLDSAVATLAGDGVSKSIGEGKLASAVSTLDGTGTVGAQVRQGEGDLVAQDAALSGLGLAAHLGEGDLVSAVATAAGSGLSLSEAEGALDAAAATMTGEGISKSSGRGSLEASTFTIAGAGLSISKGEGDLASAVANVNGDGFSQSIGQGALSSSAATLSGTGRVAWLGIGSLEAQNSVIGGEGVSKSLGQGDLAVQVSMVSGEGDTGVTAPSGTDHVYRKFNRLRARKRAA